MHCFEQLVEIMRRRALVEGIEPTYAVLVEIGQYLDVRADAGRDRNVFFEDLLKVNDFKVSYTLEFKILAEGKPFQPIG